MNRVMYSGLTSVKAVEKLFMYVDHYLVFLNQECGGAEIENICSIFADGGGTLVFTTELPVSGRLRFLNLNWEMGPQLSRSLWSPKANKGPLQYDSTHFKIGKR